MYTLKGTGDEDRTFVKGIYEKHYQYFWNYAYHLTAHTEKADDLLHQTFVNLLSSVKKLQLRERLEEESSKKAYIKKMIYYLFLDEAKSQKMEQNYLKEAIYQEKQGTFRDNEIEKFLNLELIRQASKTLTQKEKDVISFAYTFDLKRKDIAEIMKISENNVYVTLHLALKKIKASILDDGEG